MSLLEDIFLQDEANEAHELERVIEGDEYDERPRSRSATPDSDDNGPKEDEAEEDKRRVDPSSTKAKRVIKNPRFILNPARLTGPRGIQIIPDHFKDFKFKGKGHEKEDLDIVLKKLEHWAYRLYPKFQFEDCLKKIESLGKKRPVMVHLQKIRTDQFLSEETVVQKDSSDEETQPPQEEDEFDKLLQQQIELARATPAPGSVKKVMATPMKDRSPFTMPKATSSPSISDDQKERMIRNRRLAEERRLARLKQASMDSNKEDNVNNISEIIEVDEDVESNVTAKKQNRSHVIDSSDDECDLTSVQCVAVDVHDGINIHETANKINIASKGESEAGQSNLDDIEMDQNSDENHVIEIGHVDKTKDDNISSHNKISDDVIEINDPTDTISKYKEDHRDKFVSEIIEINDENEKVNTKSDKINIGADEIIEIRDQNDRVIEVSEQNKTDANEIIEINDHDAIIVEESRLSKVTDVSNISDINNLENHTNTTMNIDKKSDTIQQNVTEEILEQDVTQKDSDSKTTNSVSNLEKETKIADEVIDDLMDVDFSDDF